MNRDIDDPVTHASIPRRPLGRTGAAVSAIGLGGWHIGKVEQSDEDIVRLIRKAIDSGIDFMDNSWDYQEGRSETRMGRALEDGYLEKVFLMTKVDGRDQRTAREQLNTSLQRLRTDHVDLLQVHEVIHDDDPERVFASGGAMEAVLEARDEGLTRFIGFTGHKSPEVLGRMLDLAEDVGIRFDTVQLPLNVMDWHFRSFERELLPRLVKMGAGVLGMKALGAGDIMGTNTVGPTECIHYALSLPTSTVIIGLDSMNVLDLTIDAGRTFRQLSDEEMDALRDRTAAVAADGRFESYKITHQHDSTVQNPQWLGPSR
ncbi:MAG: aldo/keto reductase [Methanomassiliicoccus sp.]|nr:aldo/keto reductase [Methanomassiliicoccus sp.]